MALEIVASQLGLLAITDDAQRTDQIGGCHRGTLAALDGL